MSDAVLQLWYRLLLELEEDCIQSPEKVVKGNIVVSVIVKEPEPNVKSWLPPPLS